MQGFSEALLEDYGERLDAAGHDYARRIVAAARQMDALIQDLLAYSRLVRAEVSLEHGEPRDGGATRPAARSSWRSRIAAARSRSSGRSGGCGATGPCSGRS